LVPLKLALVSLLLLSSCAKVGYVFEQGVGQFSLLMSGVDNQKMLKDAKVKTEHKEKIRKIEKYKKYFYDYFEKETTDIYSETTILKGKAVTYLVIRSPFDEIKAIEECFIFAGCFPYLGFFKESSALEFAKDQEEDGMVTYVRPVYAYSTLGNFEDNILSSFFYYDDTSLAELIFHELFHTVFFAKDEVDLNENLANYFGQEMVIDYFKMDKKQQDKRSASREKRSDLNLEVVQQVEKLQDLYKKSHPKSKEGGELILRNFMKSTFEPSVQKKCLELSIMLENCFPLKRKWNNASLAAFLTYEKSMDKIKSIRDSKGLSLKDFFGYIEKEYNSYRDSSSKESFEVWFLNK
jgi:predicted aminopeptidase